MIPNNNYFKFNYLIRIVILLIQQSKLTMCIRIVLILFKAILPISQIYFTKILIDSVNLSIQERQGYNEVLIILLIQLFLLFLNNMLSEFEQLLDYKLNRNVSFHIEHMMLNRTSKLPLQFFEEATNYDFLNRASSNPGSKGLKIISSLLDIMQRIISLAGLIIILFQFHWVLVLSLIIVVIPNTLVSISIGKKEYYVERNQSEINRRSSYVSSLVKNRETAKELRVFGFSNYLISKWSHYFKLAFNQDYQVFKARVKGNIALSFFEFFMTFIFLASLLWIIIEKNYSVGDYVAISQSISSAMMMMIMVSNSFSYIYNQAPYLKDFFDFLDFSEGIGGNQKVPHDFTQKIEVNSLFFRYPSATKDTLTNITFSIKKGERVAIVGENGSGKSTLVKCMAGLYQATGGTIKYDGKDIKGIDINQNISSVFQDFVKYNFTLRENVSLSDIDNISSDQGILSSLQAVEGQSILEKLDGLDGEAGVYFPNGKDLSGGEWQRVAISRALFKKCPIIFFDEPTSSLDPISESKILELFYKITKGKTTVTVTHRLGSCRQADKIIVLKDGEIEEIGSHEELINNGGYYMSMYNAQAQWYSEDLAQQKVLL